MRYIQLITFGFIILLSTSLSFSQRDMDMNNPQIEQWRIAYYTEQLQLTSEEAQQFWPEYNAYSKEMRLLKGKMRLKMQEIKLSVDVASEQELENLADELVQLRVQEANLFKDYYPKFKGILPIQKVLRLYKAEQDFTKIIIRKLREQRQNNNNRSGGRRGGGNKNWDK